MRVWLTPFNITGQVWNMNASRRQPRVELPELEPGLTLVDVDADLGVTPVQSLLLDRVFAGAGDAYWVDAADAAQTTRLRELAERVVRAATVPLADLDELERLKRSVDRVGNSSSGRRR